MRNVGDRLACLSNCAQSVDLKFLQKECSRSLVHGRAMRRSALTFLFGAARVFDYGSRAISLPNLQIDTESDHLSYEIPLRARQKSFTIYENPEIRGTFSRQEYGTEKLPITLNDESFLLVTRG